MRYAKDAKTKVRIGLLAVVVLVLAGCNTMGRQPAFRAAAITPAQLKPGDTAVVTAEIKDRTRIVRKVEGIVQEDPTIKLKLRDDGEAPDAKAGDGIWTLQVDVPFQAPPGEFLLELTAYRADGTPVPVRSKEDGSVPLSTQIPVVIQNP